MPKILITNDDGIDSPGIFELTNEIRKIGDVIVVAPDRQQSAVGHALTVARPLRATHFRRNGKVFGYAVNGTPSDSVKLAISNLLEEKPDMLISGINHGQNTAINVLYSGTVSAATEGMLIGIPSIAVSHFSYEYSSDCRTAAAYAGRIARKVLETGMPEGVFLNVNVPDLPEEKIKGIKITKISRNIWKDKFEQRTDPFGRKYYWFAGSIEMKDPDPESDYVALDNGYVSVTPVSYSFFQQDGIEKFKDFESL